MSGTFGLRLEKETKQEKQLRILAGKIWLVNMSQWRVWDRWYCEAVSLWSLKAESFRLEGLGYSQYIIPSSLWHGCAEEVIAKPGEEVESDGSGACLMLSEILRLFPRFMRRGLLPYHAPKLSNMYCWICMMQILTEDIPVTFASTVKEGICFGKKSGANSILVHFIQRYYDCNALTVGTLCYCAQDRVNWTPNSWRAKAAPVDFWFLNVDSWGDNPADVANIVNSLQVRSRHIFLSSDASVEAMTDVGWSLYDYMSMYGLICERLEGCWEMYSSIILAGEKRVSDKGAFGEPWHFL